MATIKLGSLLIKTLSKPLANSIKQQAKNHPAFKDFCIGVAQKTHQWEHTLKTRFLGYPKESIRPLNDTRAVEAGANFMSESIIFSVAVATILAETYRSSRASTKRRRDVDDSIEEMLERHEGYNERIGQLEENVMRLTKEVETLKTENRELRAGIGWLGRAVGVKWEGDRQDMMRKLAKVGFVRACELDTGEHIGRGPAGGGNGNVTNVAGVVTLR
ncbi:optic atrophy 3 protein-domain-containing protein [Fimicolochytrium jonesii]|uniref:optic atrophy 3 protein-domain-containing protein n=1 Tax=Fimicolochytrium jonesii TaxID=1396493 RepID=UPI0022FE77D0|nr:optic atrophy 3 protein-domain-containing protein [Fimicolochytrium jonesii]KAI8822015.1 optic atrophy 3 protein-domain-containing protein [Fimicolochytrium jonesii]